MKKVIFSALIVAAAVGGTLVSNASSKKLLIPNTGPLNAPTSSCTNQVDCQTTQTPFPCKLNTVPQYQNDTTEGKCIIPLYQLTEGN